jgi:hypothetical protein
MAQQPPVAPLLGCFLMVQTGPALFLQAAFGVGKGAHTQELTILDGLNGVLKPVRGASTDVHMLPHHSWSAVQTSTLQQQRLLHSNMTAALRQPCIHVSRQVLVDSLQDPYLTGIQIQLQYTMHTNTLSWGHAACRAAVHCCWDHLAQAKLLS